MIPGVDCQRLKKLDPDPGVLLRLLERWRAEAVTTGRTIGRVALAYVAGRDGFWLVQWLQARGVEMHVIHSANVAVSRGHRWVKPIGNAHAGEPGLLLHRAAQGLAELRGVVRTVVAFCAGRVS